ncbi:uncharacterized protein TRAVEDRAFT_69277 [Trametes versicolor FP-101664 SS1]|uniref:uncharacterized protein n=1 Tax=Trametes versicolor (strain FP-101664) TaxID=717944 RepID=UPI0004622D67|nr:uncharacterized protein TRAVEDRAFT_69277 [Trametes versicolor FP-101664 SS1]EIW63178.1 hypothetical protein TRAVEDRAFT_69277 [Trametes versicolor FP-101664 SS1]
MAELSSSRINRQLRSLRMKCTSLNALTLAPTKPAVSVTYGSSHRNVSKHAQDDDGTPPLAILQSLDNFGTRLHLDRAIIENMQLSKRIYEVRDAFRNIVQSVLGPAPSLDHEERGRVLDLTSICARLIGEHVQSEIEAAFDDLRDSDVLEDDRGTQAMDDLYDQVPPAYRSRMFVAHALTYILEACPHHPTLLSALLDVSLSHGLVPEAQTVLSHLFAVAIKPRAQSTYTCPLTHPAHKNFLSTLRKSCTQSIINNRTFARLVIDCLSEPASTRLHAWTSKAVNRLAREFREQDFSGCFVPLCTGLVQAVADVKPNAKGGRKGGKVLDDVHAQLYDEAIERLRKWAITMLDRLHTSSPDSMDDFVVCVDFLVAAASHGLHESHDTPTPRPACLANALVCLTAYCVSSQRSASLHPHDFSSLQDILRSANVQNGTFNDLISHIFPLPRIELFAMPLAEPEDANTPTPPPTPPTIHGDAIEAVSALATPLRTQGLLRCEAALWLAALQHVEILIATPTVTQSMTTPGRKLSQSQLYSLRLEVMDRMEDAESRCFGGNPGGGMAGTAPPEEGEWEWEEMVGSWVLKSPAPALTKKAKDHCLTGKRRKAGARASPVLSRPPAGSLIREALTAARRTTNTEPEASASTCRSVPVRTKNPLKRKATSISTSATSSRAPSRAGSSDDEENVAPPRKVSKSTSRLHHTPTPARRSSNFATILADAQMNVISLRAEREAKAKARASTKAPTRGPFTSSRTSSVHAISAPPPPIAAWRRQSNFTTLLADSQRNVVSLREERARKAQQSVRFGQASSQETMSISDDEDDGLMAHWQSDIDPESSPVRGAGPAHPSSDDALDLFAYPDSSPVRSR